MKIFLRRHQEISVTTPEVLQSPERGFHSESVAQFFKSKNLYVQYTIPQNPARLYNCDETGITIAQHKHTKILGLTGKRQISNVQSTERESLVTVVNCMSPTRQFIRPLLVFPRKYMRPEIMNDTPPGPIHARHPRGGYRATFLLSGFFISSNIHS